MKNLPIGVKTDPINTRYSFDWLFDILAREQIKYIQLGSFFELYFLEDDYFLTLREKAEKRGLVIKSMFTSFREIGGFFYNDPHMEKAARKGYEKLIHVASLLGVDYCGTNPGAVYRDQMEDKDKGIKCYIKHMEELLPMAYEKGVKALTLEPMSCLAEPPTLPSEIDYMLHHFCRFNEKNEQSLPVYVCGDISHGYTNHHKQVVHTNIDLFRHSIKYMAEFHIKNTDHIYSGTFGFSPDEIKKGIIDLEVFKDIIYKHADDFPVQDLVGYLEINHIKFGRDYSDHLLEKALAESLQHIKEVFGN